MTNEEVLIMFLKNKGCLDTFCKNLNGVEAFDGAMYSGTYGVEDISDALLKSFSWMYTPEGYTYWHGINMKWGYMIEHFKLDGMVSFNIIVNTEHSEVLE